MSTSPKKAFLSYDAKIFNDRECVSRTTLLTSVQNARLITQEEDIETFNLTKHHPYT